MEGFVLTIIAIAIIATIGVGGVRLYEHFKAPRQHKMFRHREV